jgi:phosphatidylserine/phosphatidylglycerophosphate/cardiolipin synthase-like enzyme
MQNEIIIGKQFPLKVTPLIDLAKKSIKTVVYDWRWYENDIGNAVQIFNQSIVRAVKRGVKVEAIVNNDGILAVLKENGVAVKKLNVAGLVHAKLMIIDDKIVILGSHNYTHNAFVVNQELSVILTNPDNFLEFDNFFKTLWL